MMRNRDGIPDGQCRKFLIFGTLSEKKKLRHRADLLEGLFWAVVLATCVHNNEIVEFGVVPGSSYISTCRSLNMSQLLPN